MKHSQCAANIIGWKTLSGRSALDSRHHIEYTLWVVLRVRVCLCATGAKLDRSLRFNLRFLDGRLSKSHASILSIYLIIYFIYGITRLHRASWSYSYSWLAFIITIDLSQCSEAVSGVALLASMPLPLPLASSLLGRARTNHAGKGEMIERISECWTRVMCVTLVSTMAATDALPGLQSGKVSPQ